MGRALLLLALAALAATPAFAQPAPDPAPAGPEVRYKPVTEIEGDALQVGAGLRGPSIGLVGGLPTRTFTPLIRLRDDFDAEMLDSVHAIR